MHGKGKCNLILKCIMHLPGSLGIALMNKVLVIHEAEKRQVTALLQASPNCLSLPKWLLFGVKGKRILLKKKKKARTVGSSSCRVARGKIKAPF